MDYMDLAQEMVDSAIKAGADEAEVYLQTGRRLEVVVRMGDVETLTEASEKGLGLRVFVDKRPAFASTTDFDRDRLSDLVKDTVQIARSATRDRFNGLPETTTPVTAELDLYDPELEALSTDRMIEFAKKSEKAAFDHDSRIKNSEGAEFSSHLGTSVIANSAGVARRTSGTGCGLSCAPVAEQDGEKQVDYHWSSKRFLRQLDSPEDVGSQAAAFAVQRLGARKVETQKAPVVFSWRIGRSLLSTVFTALNGETARRGMSFLKHKLGKRIASPLVTIVDDPLMPRGLGSAPFDGEGVSARRHAVVENGILQLYFYDARTAGKYGEQPTGNAFRGFSSTPHIRPSNLTLQPTDASPEDIIRGIGNGFYVTSLIGHGENIVTGDYSVGASGMWIRDGELAFPVQEVTIAGNMLDMLNNIVRIADDLRHISSVETPTFQISEMTISGT